MRDANYFSKLRSFLLPESGRRRRCARGSVCPARIHRASFSLEPLEARVLLSADLAGAVQEMQVMEPVVQQEAAVTFLESNQGPGTSNAVATAPAETARLQSTYGNLPLSFEANHGQIDSQAEFLARGDDYSLFLTGDGAVLSLRQDDGSAPAVLNMDIIGANPDAVITGEQLLPGVANYFIGRDPTQWRTDIPTYEQVRYDDVYTGIDLLYYGKRGQLEYDFVVEPGTDPGVIQFRLAGEDNLQIDEQGNLDVQIGDETLQLLKPVVYQIIDGIRQEINGSFVLNEDGSVGFQVGAYDVGQSLIIDPVLLYSTYFGGTGGEDVTGLVVGSSGNTYISGLTASNNLPEAPPRASNRFDTDVFVTKLNPTGTAVLYSTYFGGTGTEERDGNANGDLIAVDDAGNAYVGGTTLSSDFPTTSGAYDTTPNGAQDGFVTKLDAGGAIVYSTYLGGSRSDSIYAIAVDSARQVYVTGVTRSASTTIDAANYPTTPGAFQRTTLPGPNSPVDAFVSKLNPAGNGLIYSTYLSGIFEDSGRGIAVDQQGYAYVTGATGTHIDSFGRVSGGFPNGFTTEQGFMPWVGTFQDGPTGANADAFVTKVNLTGTGLIYSRYLGGSTTDVGQAIAIDGSSNAYVTGATISANFPVTAGAFQTTPGSEFSKGFVTKLDPTGANRVYSTYVRGVSDLTDIVVDSGGRAAGTGQTRSTNFETRDPLQPMYSGQGDDAVVLVLNFPGSGLAFSSYLGGNGNDYGRGVAWDAAGNLYVGGYTDSTNFPVTSGVVQPFNRGGDAFVTKIGFNQAPVANSQPVTTPEDTARMIILTGSDPEGAALTFTIVTPPVRGSLSTITQLNPTSAQVTYTPTDNLNGADSFTYKVHDGQVDSNVATVSITVTPVNDPPTFTDIAEQTIDEDAPSQNILIAGVSPGGGADEAGQPVSLSAISGHPAIVPHPTISGTGPTRTLTYQPAANANGMVTITVTANDGQPENNMLSKSFTINVTPVTDPPTAGNDMTDVAEDSGATPINVLANDSITPDTGETLSIIAVTQGNNGAVVITGKGTGLTYRPNDNFFGPDSFNYTISDGNGGQATATVSVDVTPVNDAPVATNDVYMIAEDTVMTVAARGVLLNDSDIDSAVFTAVLVSNPTNGALTLNADGSVTYTPGTNFNGPDSFTYRVNDGQANSNIATVNITVTPINDAPVANAGPDQTVQGGLVTLDGTASSDLEGNTPLTFAWTLTKPAGSAASLVNPTSDRPTFTPDMVGTYTAQLRVTDTLGAVSTPATVLIHVVPLSVGIDIRPGASPNTINLGSKGVVPVAILSRPTFDPINGATKVDPESVTLAGASVQFKGNGTPMTLVRDVNGDGLEDLIIDVNTEALQLSSTDTQAVLEGRTVSGIFIRGTNSIRVVP
ncbi:MAG TPA: tandem-95 repeat protein [Nitrospiraceae bacterium]|nr:tandem-95 repeat protein [Nitrospiraceae bacterium]